MSTKSNQLEQRLPEGLVVDSAWLAAHGFSSSLRAKYVAAGRLAQPARRVYRRPRGTLSWEQVVVSLQAMLRHRVVVGGMTALELQGYGHYVKSSQQTVHLHGPERPPRWISTLPLAQRFVYRDSRVLLGDDAFTLPSLDADIETSAPHVRNHGLRILPWGHWSWPLVVSSPERAVLELLDELPSKKTFEHVDEVMSGLSDVRPTEMQRLLERCRSVKTKRLFFVFADRHNHAWLKHIERDSIDLGTGKRVLVKGGRLNTRYAITIPSSFADAS